MSIFNRYFWTFFLVLNFGFVKSGQFELLYQYLLSNPVATVEGKILESEYTRIKGVRAAATRGYHVKYEYRISREYYTSEVVNYRVWGRDEERIVNAYPIGSVVTVYYDPKKPEYAILEDIGVPYSIFLSIVGNFIAAAFIGLFGN